MAGNSDIDNCNFALGLCSIDPIASFTDGTVQSDRARDVYEPTVTQLLVEHGWTFAGKYQQLTPSNTEIPELPWLLAYEMPPAVLEVRSLKMNGKDVAYEINGNFVYTKLTVDDLPILEFTQRVTEDKFSEHFRSLLRFRLAALLAASITRSESLSNMWMAEYDRITGKTKHRDSAQQTTKQIAPSRFLARR